MGSRVLEARLHVLAAVRRGLAPGVPVSVKETAEALRLSHTPVREALERLVGEGVLVTTPDRHGFAVPRLTVRDVAGLHSLFGALLQGLAGRPFDDDGAASWAPDRRDPSAALAEAVAGACSWPDAAMLAAALRSNELRLVAHRRVEPIVFRDWGAQLTRLRAALSTGGGEARRAIDAFTRARTGAAAAVVAAVEDAAGVATPDRFQV